MEFSTTAPTWMFFCCAPSAARQINLRHNINGRKSRIERQRPSQIISTFTLAVSFRIATPKSERNIPTFIRVAFRLGKPSRRFLKSADMKAKFTDLHSLQSVALRVQGIRIERRRPSSPEKTPLRLKTI